MKQFSDEEKTVAAVLARTDLYFFSRWMFINRKGFAWIRGNHHKIICDALMRVFNGECKRLIINVPPRYGKTELAVINFIAWCFGQQPDCEFIHTSYSGRLAANNSFLTRELVSTAAYQNIFPRVLLRDDSKAKDEWRTTEGGVMYAVGAGGAITGYGAGKHRESFGGCILIDDPHKPDEVRSDVMRANVIDWFQNTLESRKNSRDTPIVLIMQRLHERDLSGWLLDGGNGEEWENICLPAIQDDGSALWEDKHSIDELLRMREAAPHMFSGQYMQSPSPAEGNIFKPEKINIIEAVPNGTVFVRAWDLAATMPKHGNDPDYTVGAKVGIMPDGRYLISDIVRLRGAPEDVEAAIVNTAKRDGIACRIRIPQDPGQAGKAQVAYLTKQLSGFAVISSTISGDKVTRSEPFAAQTNVGNVCALNASWVDSMMDEMRMFPNGAHDDQIDALSDAFSMISGGTFNIRALV